MYFLTIWKFKTNWFQSFDSCWVYPLFHTKSTCRWLNTKKYKRYLLYLHFFKEKAWVNCRDQVRSVRLTITFLLYFSYIICTRSIISYNKTIMQTNVKLNLPFSIWLSIEGIPCLQRSFFIGSFINGEILYIYLVWAEVILLLLRFSVNEDI